MERLDFQDDDVQDSPRSLDPREGDEHSDEEGEGEAEEVAPLHRYRRMSGEPKPMAFQIDPVLETREVSVGQKIGGKRGEVTDAYLVMCINFLCCLACRGDEFYRNNAPESLRSVAADNFKNIIAEGTRWPQREEARAMIKGFRLVRDNDHQVSWDKKLEFPEEIIDAAKKFMLYQGADEPKAELGGRVGSKAKDCKSEINSQVNRHFPKRRGSGRCETQDLHATLQGLWPDVEYEKEKDKGANMRCKLNKKLAENKSSFLFSLHLIFAPLSFSFSYATSGHRP
jgi:hypothetical protein